MDETKSPGALERRWALVLFCLGALACGLRLASALAIWSLPEAYLLNADSADYHRYALCVAGLAEGELPAVFWFSPLTIFWGALWHTLFGPSVWAVIIAQVMLGTATTLIVAAIGRAVYDASAGLVAGLFAAVLKPFLVYDVAILSTSLTVFLSALVVWSCLWAVRRVSPGRCAALGLVLGLWIACRPNMAVFVPVALLLVWSAGRSFPLRIRAASVFAVVAVAALVIAPITIANAVRGGVFVPVTSAAGINLFIGNNQGAQGHPTPVFGERTADQAQELFSRRAEAATGRRLDVAELSSFWAHMAWREVADDPGRFLALLGKKAVYAVNDFEIPDSWNIPFLEREVPFLALPFPGFGVVFPLGAIGLLVIWRRRVPGARAVHGVAAASIATLLLFFALDRHRAPFTVALTVGAGAAAAWVAGIVSALRLKERWKARRALVAKLLAAVAATAVLSIAAYLPILHDVPTEELERLASACEKDGRLEDAMLHFRRAMALYEIDKDTPAAGRMARAMERLRARRSPGERTTP
jgi:4-amino-4-deoxy-L-arabinose transferase-like glycosyltransferase